MKGTGRRTAIGSTRPRCHTWQRQKPPCIAHSVARIEKEMGRRKGGGVTKQNRANQGQVKRKIVGRKKRASEAQKETKNKRTKGNKWSEKIPPKPNKESKKASKQRHKSKGETKTMPKRKNWKQSRHSGANKGTTNTTSKKLKQAQQPEEKNKTNKTTTFRTVERREVKKRRAMKNCERRVEGGSNEVSEMR